MKTKCTKKLLALLLAACMALSLVSVIYAEEATASTAKDYATAADGDLLWTVDFNFSDLYKKMLVDKSIENSITISDTEAGAGAKLTIGTKEQGSGYYGGDLPQYPIADHVYTLSWYVENTAPSDVRIASQLFSVTDAKNNSYRIGINTTKSAQFNNSMLIVNGTNSVNLPSVARKVDTANKNRQYFRAVVDGVNMVAYFYTLDTNDTYQLLYTFKIGTLKAANPCLSIGVFCWDPIIGEISMGDMQIFKGDLMNADQGKKDYRAAYDKAADGDVLYNVDFADITSGDSAFIKMRDNASVTVNAGTMSFTKSDKAAAQLLAAYFPDMEAHLYGSYTYEFYLTSAKRVDFGVLGRYNGTNWDCEIGFSYFNSTAANMFMKDRGWANVSNTALNGAPYNCTLTVHGTANQKPKTGEGIACNVKIEVDTVNHVINNYILTDDGFVKTASIGYEGTELCPVIYPYAYDASTNATFSNMVIRKGLTANMAPSQTCVEMEGLQIGTTADGKLNVRFVGSGNQKDFCRLGFEITATVGDETRTFTYRTRIGVKNLTATSLDAALTAMTAESAGAAYLYGYTLTGVPATGTVTFTVRPYSLLESGEVRYGVSTTYTLENGVLK